MSRQVIKWFRMSETFLRLVANCTVPPSFHKVVNTSFQSSHHLMLWSIPCLVQSYYQMVKIQSVSSETLLLPGTKVYCHSHLKPTSFVATGFKFSLNTLSRWGLCMYYVKDVLFSHSVVMVEKTTLQCLIKLVYLYGVTIESQIRTFVMYILYRITENEI